MDLLKPIISRFRQSLDELLVRAVIHNNFKVARVALFLRANPNANSGRSVAEAIDRNNLVMSQMLLRKVKRISPSSQVWESLMKPIEVGDFPIVNLVLSVGVGGESEDHENKEILGWAYSERCRAVYRQGHGDFVEDYKAPAEHMSNAFARGENDPIAERILKLANEVGALDAFHGSARAPIQVLGLG